MGYPNSVEEIDDGMIAEGWDEIYDSGDKSLIKEFELNSEIAKELTVMNKLAENGYGYYSDNCYDEVDGDTTYYCKRCLQPECGKRKAHRI